MVPSEGVGCLSKAAVDAVGEAAGGGGGGLSLLTLHSINLSLSLAHLLSLAGRFLRLRGMAGLVASGEAWILHQKSMRTTPCLLTVSIVAQIPLSTHSSKSVSSRDGVGPAAGGTPLLYEAGLVAVLVSCCCTCWFLTPTPLSPPPLELPIVRGGGVGGGVASWQQGKNLSLRMLAVH